MARTQILKNIRPDIFLMTRKVFGILFFFFFQFFIAQVTSSKVSSLAESKTADYISDSICSSKHLAGHLCSHIIFMTSETTMVDRKKEVDGMLVIFDSPNSKIKKIINKKYSIRKKGLRKSTHSNL